MQLRVGQTLVSPVDTASFVVVRAPSAEVELTCAGVPLWDPKGGGDTPDGAADPAQQDGTQLGKRYVDAELGLELLCAKPGQGTLAANGAPLPLKDAKALPASD
ncbi:hypothetical protein [Geodermatophilus sp. URMC 64]